MNLMHEVLPILAEMETNGSAVDLEALDKLEAEYLEEKEQLEGDLKEIVYRVMGNPHYSLTSPDDLSRILFSREVPNKKRWKSVFNLGTEVKYGRVVAKRRTRMTRKAFINHVKAQTRVLYKKEAQKCTECDGQGKTQLLKKNGEPRKNLSRCVYCGGSGVLYFDKLPRELAGLGLIPRSPAYVSANGFSTSHAAIEEYLKYAKHPDAREFLTKMVRLSAVSHYLSNFVNGIRKGIAPDGYLHTRYMQFVTATGRLSSRNPNYHNQPRGGTFPIRSVIISRWEGGKITDADEGQLEFRIAAELSGCKIALKDILDGVDVHARTSDILTSEGQETDRQGAKSHTFKPLYGGSSGTKAEQTYYKSFLERYTGIKRWHDKLCDGAVRHGYISLPSGRVYNFPSASRFSNGSVSGRTKIVNYPVQGFATADIMLLALVEVARVLKAHKVQSILINTVHDSIVIDTHPSEIALIPRLVGEAMVNVDIQVKKFFGYVMSVPLSVEVKQGDNWLRTETVWSGSNEERLKKNWYWRNKITLV